MLCAFWCWLDDCSIGLLQSFQNICKLVLIKLPTAKRHTFNLRCLFYVTLSLYVSMRPSVCLCGTNELDTSFIIIIVYFVSLMSMSWLQCGTAGRLSVLYLSVSLPQRSSQLKLALVCEVTPEPPILRCFVLSTQPFRHFVTFLDYRFQLLSLWNMETGQQEVTRFMEHAEASNFNKFTAIIGLIIVTAEYQNTRMIQLKA